MGTKLFQPDRPHSKEISWCPGCGNFAIRLVLMEALEELGFKPENTAVVSGIGQAGKMPHYINANGFHSLHGRAIPIGTGLKLANPTLNVIIVGGDGDMYSEGMGHLVHGIKRNANVTVLVHDNQVYGLTKGQTSPTTMIGMKTSTHPDGAFVEPINPIALAISLDCSFVARTFIGYKDETKTIIKEAIQHEGFSFVDIFQPCVTFNRVNTYDWYREHTKFIENLDTSDRKRAFELSLDTNPYNLGIFYKTNRAIFEKTIDGYKVCNKPLYKRTVNIDGINEFIDKNYKL
jgi:2-oxoglutarate ferredoxin oxidoreductase subunit beta